MWCQSNLFYRFLSYLSRDASGNTVDPTNLELLGGKKRKVRKFRKTTKSKKVRKTRNSKKTRKTTKSKKVRKTKKSTKYKKVRKSRRIIKK